MIVIADTSGILALFNRAEPEHRAVRKAVDEASLLVISPLALTEVHHVASVRASRKAADGMLRLLADRASALRVTLADTTPEILGTAVSARARYQDLDLDLVDAINIALAAVYDTTAILTLDRRDFRALRPLTSSPAFRVLPDDL
ncbi:type II toxin-antitoxin system VapC family toxin [Streptomyces oceani]|uniref:Ribonuclease VapC n=1 Tax=Streptomyces oceani TaxID=1075402 RepID=A0A1E7JW75_9ACTN|nr:PIN domain-containing protein [Streptomyces oceani]OEU95776.1 twitching motility protein PilT [Streptomyces oceani]